MSKPLLSICIIFRNDIRCIERCLKALQPLRDMTSCELVMADTGSEDGSRTIAEKFADIVIDFPWVDDFSAARNAVISRCSGKWLFTIDTDEYLDENVSQLVGFLNDSTRTEGACTVLVRNYDTFDMEGNYSDFKAMRIVRVFPGICYTGAIHERWAFQKGELRVFPLSQVILHHDGYAEMDSDNERSRTKRKRNMTLIRKQLEKTPENLLVRLEWLESGTLEDDYVEQIRQTVELVKEKAVGWNDVGPSILREAVYTAQNKELPELEEWSHMAEAWFPDSLYTRLDIEYASFIRSWNKKDYADCVLRGERYLVAIEDYHNGVDPTAEMWSTLNMAAPQRECGAKILLASAHSSEGNFERALELLSNIDFTLLDEKQTSDLLKAAQDLHSKCELDTSLLILSIWDGISQEKPSKRKRNIRISSFIKTSGSALMPSTIEKEKLENGIGRHRYTLYLPLIGKCEIGIAATVLEMNNPVEMEALLEQVEDWNKFSIHALAHALEHDVNFPLKTKLLRVEEIANLTSRLAKNKERFLSLAFHIADNSNVEEWKNLLWVQGVLLAAIRSYPWIDEKRNEEQGMTLARSFAAIEGMFLPRCYTSEMLQEDRLFTLPPLHRFGWYCAQAFDALEKGDTVEYVRLLRAGLDACEGMTNMVEFLANHTAEVQQLLTPPELKVLADQVRVILARFSPDDPAVAALKQSEAYQKVAHLIEGMAVPVWGGLTQ